jgi:hypothetical protein
LKTTSKSVVANATKILEVTLEAIDNLDWPEDDVTNMVIIFPNYNLDKMDF